MSNVTLAYLCNDLANAEDYRVEGGIAYYKEERIGEFTEVVEEGVDSIKYNIYFTPEKPVESIDVSFTIVNP